MKTETLETTMKFWSESPESAMSHPTVTARSNGSGVQLQSGRFQMMLDLPPALGGANEAPSPTAFLLSALAGCAVAFIQNVLAPQLGVRVYKVAARASCDSDLRGLLGSPEATPELQNLRLDLEVESPDGEEAVCRLVDVWQERCPTFLALTGAIPVATSLKVLDWYRPAAP